MFKRLIAVPVVALCVGTGMTTAQTSQSTQGTADTYMWHGELVSFDASTRAVTVKALVLPGVEEEVGGFNVGDRVLVTWSGLDRNAGAVRQRRTSWPALAGPNHPTPEARSDLARRAGADECETPSARPRGSC